MENRDVDSIHNIYAVIIKSCYFEDFYDRVKRREKVIKLFIRCIVREVKSEIPSAS